MTGVAVLAAMMCAWFLVGSEGPGVARLLPKARSSPVVDWWKVAFIVDAFLLVSGVFIKAVAVVAVLCLAGTTLAWVVGVRTCQRRAAKRRTDVVRMAQVLESLMGLGHLPSTALVVAAEEFPVLAPVVAAQRMGGDPWEVMEQMAVVPGQEGLSQIGHAWKISQVCGGSMHASLEQVRKNLEESADTATIVAGEVAGPRATGQILAALPLLGLGMAAGIGISPVEFFLSGIGGRACLVAGVVFICVGVMWSEILVSRIVGTSKKSSPVGQ